MVGYVIKEDRGSRLNGLKKILVYFFISISVLQVTDGQ